MYAIVDIETTGGKFNEEGMTEIAIYQFDGQQVVDQFITLVNPEKEIQPFVVQLTGIHQKMLVNAPKFYEIAKRIVEITENSTIVAHNASFDYRILQNEFKRFGYDYQRNTLCTVELSRKLIPNLPSYSLGKLCRSLGIATSDRHRASGDALATVKLFKLLLNKDNKKEILQNCTKYNATKNSKTPNLFLEKLLHKIPRITGLFYLHNTQGQIIYVGKHKNIYNSFNQLILRKSKSAQLLLSKVKNISTEETGSELLANIKYASTLASVHPKYNRKSKTNIPTSVFQLDTALLIDKGRNVSEKSVFLIENQTLVGYAYIDLLYQLNNLDKLKNLLTPLPDNLENRYLIKKYLDQQKFKQVIRLDLLASNNPTTV